MLRSSLILAVSTVTLMACASGPASTTAVSAETDNPVTLSASLSSHDLAMQTVDELVAAGSIQVAIDRLTQLTGDPSLTREQVADTLLRRGELRFGEGGMDLQGAISDLEEITTDYSDTTAAVQATVMLEAARERAAMLTALLDEPGTTSSQKFDILMQLGRHQEAMDLMLAYDITPDDQTLMAMSEIGYLCEGDALTGREYVATDKDGMIHNFRFCDFGK